MLEGHYVRLEPLSAAHGDGLFTASAVPDAEAKFAWLCDSPPTNRENFLAWVEQAGRGTDPCSSLSSTRPAARRQEGNL